MKFRPIHLNHYKGARWEQGAWHIRNNCKMEISKKGDQDIWGKQEILEKILVVIRKTNKNVLSNSWVWKGWEPLLYGLHP